MRKEQFIELWNDCSSDLERWKFIISIKHKLPTDLEITIDNDDLSICFTDDEDSEVLTFDNFGYSAIKEILDALEINADFV